VNRTYDQVMDDLRQVLANFEGKEYSGEIGPKTQFFGEMGYASIDAVVLAEDLEEFYGRKFPFHEFVDELRDREAEDLEVGQLAEFLQRHLS
jgi:acyl carrier protein